MMTDDIASLVLGHLRHIRGLVDQIGQDVTDLKHRMSRLESAMAGVKRELTKGDETDPRDIDRHCDRKRP